MRKEFFNVASYNTAKRKAPWACVIAKVCGGYTAFESVDDYRVWKNQK
jgi:hypothetical protein